MARSTLKKVRGIELLYGWSGLGVLGFLLGASILPAAAQSPSTEPAVSITGGPSVTEGADATFTLTANPAPAADITVKVERDQRLLFTYAGRPARTAHGDHRHGQLHGGHGERRRGKCR